ncbi:MAG: hypothetical protein HYV07_11075 [Deltaproteobacteria bacterium]|nr:hypothetical protein [Deltaproteobacteria bacterium]
MRSIRLAVPSLVLVLAGCSGFDEFYTREESARIESLANLPDPAPDPANKYGGDAAAADFGQQLYFDTRFSGPATQRDTLGRDAVFARAKRGDPVNLSCASCHDPKTGGSDHTSVPGHVSVGAGWYDVNSMPTVNSAYYDLKYWNGRYDSLVWQILAVNESPVSMNSTRLKNAWLIHDLYLDLYRAVFDDDFPFDFHAAGIDRNAMASRIEPAQKDGAANPRAGQCLLARTETSTSPVCPSDVCREASIGEKDYCLPRWPLSGKPGADRTCDEANPAGDAFDCMAAEDKDAITRVYVNFAKAIAAYEYKLISRDSAFDRFVDAGETSTLVSDSAKRGAKLFVGKASCIECHSGALFSDQDFHNIGVPQVGAGVPTVAECTAKTSCDCESVPSKDCLPWGAFNGLQKLQANLELRIDGPKWSDDPTGASEVRKSWYTRKLGDELKGAWRTPSLRDVALTAPYMHNGVYTTLNEVIWHYDGGGTHDGAAPDSLSVRVAPLGLTDAEVDDLAAFLETLTGAPLPETLVKSPTLPPG